MAVKQMVVNQMSVNQMSVNQMSVNQMADNQMSVNQCLLTRCLFAKLFSAKRRETIFILCTFKFAIAIIFIIFKIEIFISKEPQGSGILFIYRK